MELRDEVRATLRVVSAARKVIRVWDEAGEAEYPADSDDLWDEFHTNALPQLQAALRALDAMVQPPPTPARAGGEERAG